MGAEINFFYAELWRFDDILIQLKQAVEQIIELTVICWTNNWVDSDLRCLDA